MTRRRSSRRLRSVPSLPFLLALVGTLCRSQAEAIVTARACTAQYNNVTNAFAAVDRDADAVEDHDQTAPEDVFRNGCESASDAVTSSASAPPHDANASASSQATITADTPGDAVDEIGVQLDGAVDASLPVLDGTVVVSGANARAAVSFTLELFVEGAAVPYEVAINDFPESGDGVNASVELDGIAAGTTDDEVLFRRQLLGNGQLVTAGTANGAIPPGRWFFHLGFGTSADNGGTSSGSVGAVLRLTEPSEIRWAAPVSGAFNVAANWDPNQVPDAASPTLFALVGQYDVTVDQPRSIARATVRTSALDLLGAPLALLADPSLLVGDGATLALFTTLDTAGVRIGDVAGARATVRVHPGGTLLASGATRIGDGAAGTLEIAGGNATVDTLRVDGPLDPGGGSALTFAADALAARIALALPHDDPGESTGPLLRVTSGGSALGGFTASHVRLGGAGGFGEAIAEFGGRATVSDETTVGSGGRGILRVLGRNNQNRATWATGGLLTVGDDDLAQLRVTSSGRVTATDAVLGARSGGDGFALVVEADAGLQAPSTLDVSGQLVVGDAGAGELQVGSDALVKAGAVAIGTSLGGTGTVFVGSSAKLEAAGTLEVGRDGEASLEIEDATVQAGATLIAANGPAPGAPPPTVDLSSRASFATGILRVGDGFNRVPGIVHVGSGSEISVQTGRTVLEDGEILVEGIASVGIPFSSTLRIRELTVFGGELRAEARGQIDSRDAVLTQLLGEAPGVVRITGDGTQWQVLGSLIIGEPAAGLDPPRAGELVLADRGSVEVLGPLTVHGAGVIRGTGTVRVGRTEINPNGGTLTNLGTILPGSSPGTLVIDANFVQGPTGRLVMEVGGLAPGDMDVLDVSAKATLGGTLELRFVNGFVPHAGDVLPILPIGGKRKGSFAAVEVKGLAPGFDYGLGLSNGALGITAFNDGTPVGCADPTDGDQDGVPDCSDVCPTVADAAQTDGDGDGRGDACDPCHGGMPVLKPLLAIEKGALAFKGKLVVPTASTLTPSATGVRLFVTDGHGATVLDALAPGGAFDAATKSGWKGLRFKSPSGAIAALALTQKKNTLAEVGFKMSARLAAPTAGALALPLTASLVLDSTSPVSPCGDARFVGPVAVNPTCTLKKDALACRQQKKR